MQYLQYKYPIKTMKKCDVMGQNYVSIYLFILQHPLMSIMCSWNMISDCKNVDNVIILFCYFNCNSTIFLLVFNTFVTFTIPIFSF